MATQQSDLPVEIIYEEVEHLTQKGVSIGRAYDIIAGIFEMERDAVVKAYLSIENNRLKMRIEAKKRYPALVAMDVAKMYAALGVKDK